MPIRITQADAGPRLLATPCSSFSTHWAKVAAIDERHALTSVEPEPMTRDLFDRMLLAQCQVEGLRFVTIDRALVAHPLAAGG